MISKIDHIGIAVRSIEATLPVYQNAMGLRFIGTETVESQKVKTAFLEAGDVHIELLEPTDEDSPIAKFIEKNGEGMHHIAYATDSIQEQLDQASSEGLRLIHEKPVPGAHGKLVAFLHPKSTHGVLTEYCMDKKD